MDVPVEMVAKLADVDVTLREVMDFEEGDIIPLEVPDNLTVFIEDCLPFMRNGSVHETILR